MLYQKKGGISDIIRNERPFLRLSLFFVTLFNKFYWFKLILKRYAKISKKANVSVLFWLFL